MLRFVQGDIFGAEVEAMVNPVNCKGVMGRGLAAEFKRRYPASFVEYAAACKRGEVEPGVMLFFDAEAEPRWVIQFPTKRHWRSKSRMEDIEAGLIALADELQKRQIASVAIPALGCGLGGLDWADVRARIEEILGALDGIDVWVFEPQEPLRS